MMKVTYEDGHQRTELMRAMGATHEDAEAQLQRHLSSELAKALADPAVKKVEAIKNIGRNASCPCGSGKKFKKCCIDKVKQI